MKFILKWNMVKKNSRIDFLLKGEGLPDCYVEVKSITFVKVH